MVASFIALFISGVSLWFVTLFGSRPMSGAELFAILSGVAFMCACFVGPALTVDCVNEERNNGTLGLLFLTNLPGISVLLGKLAGHGLQALYSIVSIIPVMALPVLLGGADAASLVKTALVLLVTMILSLIIGMFASTVCRKVWMAAALSIFILGILIVGIPIVAVILRLNQQMSWANALELLSPRYSLSMARPTAAMGPIDPLWTALGVQVLIAFVFFGLVAFLLPRVWKEGRSGRKALAIFSKWRALKFGSREARRTLREHLLAINPFLWLSSRERFGAMGHALVFMILVIGIAWTGNHVRLGSGPFPDDFLSPMLVWILGTPLLYLCFCFRLATAASERFAEDRKSGALDLILCTPLQSRQIVRGHWLGLIRRFWGAAALLLGVHAFVLNYIMEAIRLESRLHPFDLREIVVRPLRHLLGASWIPNEHAPFYIACLAVLTAAILIVVLWIALVWLGMALSLKMRREILAAWVSLILLAAPPIPLFVLSVALLDNKRLFANDLFLGMLRLGASGFFIVLANALLWMFLARRWTYGALRGAAAPASPIQLAESRE
ncbi:MAG: ABC transporter permease subunit [Verrucomicrobiota bacterium]